MSCPLCLVYTFVKFGDFNVYKALPFSQSLYLGFDKDKDKFCFL